MLLALVSLLLNCRTEDLLEKDNSTNQSVSFGKFISRKVSPVEFQKIIGLNEKFSKNESILAQKMSTGKSILDGATIDSAYAMETTDGNIISYTFPVYRNNQKGFFENLVLQKKVGEQSFKSYLYKYPRVGANKYDAQHIEIYNIDNILINTTGKLNFVTTSSITGCYEIQTTSADCGFAGHHTNGQYCPQSGAYMPYDYATIFDNCPPSGGGGGGSSTPGNNNPSPGSETDYGVTTPVPNYPKWGICSERTGAHWDALGLNSSQLAFINAYAQNALRGEMTMFLGNNEVFTFDCNSPRDISPEVKTVGLWILNYAMTNPEFLNSEYWANFVNSDLRLQQGAINFIIQNNLSWKSFEEMFFFADKFLKENPDTENIEQIFQRLQNLDNALTQNPNLLLDIPCDQLPQWQAAALHQVPQSIKDKLKNINNLTNWYQGDLEIQSLDNAKGKSINMDLFEIRIETLPKKPGTNTKYTQKEFFDYFRLHINDFAEKFTPIVDTNLGVNDIALWNSPNPLGALISIDIPVLGDTVHDDGTVVCSGVSTNAWVFTTIKSPWDHAHPVSGNRFFSYHDSNGVMTIYTRGVDRVELPVFNMLSTAENPAYQGADILWAGMQIKLAKFVNDNHGIALIPAPTQYRPDWLKARDYLKGKQPISSLGCK